MYSAEKKNIKYDGLALILHYTVLHFTSEFVQGCYI